MGIDLYSPPKFFDELEQLFIAHSIYCRLHLVCLKLNNWLRIPIDDINIVFAVSRNTVGRLSMKTFDKPTLDQTNNTHKFIY